MRIIIGLFLLFGAFQANGQAYFPGSLGYANRAALADPYILADSVPAKKWFVSRYTGISTSFSFSKFGNATVVSVPLGVQLNRKLTNNLYAFGGLSIAPSYINFNSSFARPIPGKFGQQNNFLKTNQLGISSRAEMGLMYVNDAKTFSISGSIGVEHNSYPGLYPAQMNVAPPPPMHPQQR